MPDIINQWNFVIKKKKKKLQLHVVVLVRHINTYYQKVSRHKYFLL